MVKSKEAVGFGLVSVRIRLERVKKLCRSVPKLSGGCGGLRTTTGGLTTDDQCEQEEGESETSHCFRKRNSFCGGMVTIGSS